MNFRKKLAKASSAWFTAPYNLRFNGKWQLKLFFKPQYANQPDFIRRFEVEAQTIARLEHPYIVPLYDYWREPDGAFLVMRYMRGGSAQDTLARRSLVSG